MPSDFIHFFQSINVLHASIVEEHDTGELIVGSIDMQRVLTRTEGVILGWHQEEDNEPRIIELTPLVWTLGEMSDNTFIIERRNIPHPQQGSNNMLPPTTVKKYRIDFGDI